MIRTLDPAAVLTRRLEQLHDADYMRTVLQHALDRLLPRVELVEAYEVDYCKIKPWRDVSLTLALTLRSISTGERRRQIVAGSIWSTVDEARKQLQSSVDGAHPIAPCHGSLEEQRPRAQVALVPDMAMILRLFPSDPVLTGLSWATDRTGMTALLDAHLPDCRNEGWRIRDLQHEPLHYKPGRLCTLRYTLTLDHPRHPNSKQLHVFGKVYRDDRWQQAYATLTTIWEASMASAGRWYAARPIAAVASPRLTVQSAVDGCRFRQVLGDLTRDDADSDELARMERHLDAVAQALQSMQQVHVPLGPCLDFAGLLGAQRHNLEYLRDVHEGVAAELDRLRTEIERLASTLPASALGLAHGDFAHGNVLLDDERVGIIDFDRVCQAEPAYDVAYFLTHLTSFGLRHPRRAVVLSRLAAHFREAYLAVAPAVSSRRLALYEALDLSAYVLRNFRKQSHQAKWLRWAAGQIESAWERLDHARSAQ
ncbi:MAG: hypothetical protein DMF90_17105 [Acidobacteria bacterium]|nr:MAG: hypothetical protein DMF90_17105 [Acidobacteriota bacterium]